MQAIIKYTLPMSNGFLTWVFEEMNRRDWRNADLARRSGLSDATVSRVFSGERLPSWDFCAGVAQAFGMRAEEIFRQAGLLPSLPPEVVNEQQLVYLYRHLDPARQQAALAMMHGLAQSEPHYTYTPIKNESAPATCVVESILALASEGQKREAISMLLASAPEESQQRTMQRVLDFLELIISESKKMAIGAEVGGQR